MVLRKSNKNKKTSSSAGQSQSGASLVSDRLEKKKTNKNNNTMTLETALKELDINVKQGGKRKVCNCQGKF
jgi:hypothetical protein